MRPHRTLMGSSSHSTAPVPGSQGGGGCQEPLSVKVQAGWDIPFHSIPGMEKWCRSPASAIKVVRREDICWGDICSLTGSLSCTSETKGITEQRQAEDTWVHVCLLLFLLPQGSWAWCCGTCDSKHLRCTEHKDTKDKVRWRHREAPAAAAQGVAALGRSDGDRDNKTTGNFLEVTQLLQCALVLPHTYFPYLLHADPLWQAANRISTQGLSQMPYSVGYAHLHPPVGHT